MRASRLLSLLFAFSFGPILFADSAALLLTKVGSNEADPPGSLVTIPVSFANHGTAYAMDVRLTMTIPPGATFSGASAGCAGPPAGQTGDVVCSLPYLNTPINGPNYGLATLEFIVKLDPAALPGPLAFPVTLTCTNNSNPPATGTAKIQVLALADVTIAMTSPSVVNAGSVFDNVVTVTNNGPGAAVQPRVQLQFANSSPQSPAAPAGWTCTTSSGYASCTPAASFQPGTATFTFPAVAASSGTMTQTAWVSLFNDANPQDDQTITTTEVAVQATPGPAIQLTLTAAPDVVHPGDLLTYSAKIANPSSFDARDVVLRWALPGEVVSTTCGVPSNTSCFFSTITAGATQTATRTVRVGPTPGSTLPASATVNGSNVLFDPITDDARLSTNVAETPSPARRRAAHH